MAPRTFAEDDLRAVLLASADTTDDVSHLRARLDRLLLDASEIDADQIVSLPEPDARPSVRSAAYWRAHRWQLVTGAALAACLVGALMVVFTVLPGGTPISPTKHPTAYPTPDPKLTVPAKVAKQFPPGSIILRRFSGVGPHVVQLGDLPAVPDHEYEMDGACSRGRITLQHAGITNCDGKLGFGLGINGHPHSMRITVRPDVRWHFLLVFEPLENTNANFGSASMGGNDEAAAVHAIIRDSRRGWHLSEGGDATVQVPVLHLKHPVLQVTCSGSGITASTSDGTIDNAYDKDCWSGYIYQWRVPSWQEPLTLTVRASPDTTWTIGLIPSGP
jgi:hypothetical protein